MVKFVETEKSISLGQIKNLGSSLGINFHTEYINHLLQYNGGRCVPNVFSFMENDVLTKSSVERFLALYDGEYDNLEDYCNMYKFDEKRMPNLFFPIAHDPGGNLVCMNSLDGKIYFWDHEKEVDYNQSDDNDTSNLYFVAEDLNEFISNLTEA